MRKKPSEREILALLSRASAPMKATEIARHLGCERWDANGVLYAGLGTVFLRDAVFRWRSAKGARGVPVAMEVAPIEVHSYFTPEDSPIEEFCRRIGAAQNEILIQAFFIWSEGLVASLVQAHRRGVDVKMIMGKTSSSGSHGRDPCVRHGGRQNGQLLELHASGVAIWVDWNEDHNHNKCAVIDEILTVTGGLNFCDYSQKNSDNMVMIQSREVASAFKKNWEKNRRETCEPFERE